MADDIYNDILWRLRIPLPYELRGLTVSDLMNERKDAADEIERLRAAMERLYDQAADEIERLRAEVENLHIYLYNTGMWFICGCGRDRCTEMRVYLGTVKPDV